MQQGNHLLHLFLAKRAVFSPLYAAIFIQHHDGRTLFIKLPRFADHAVAVDDKLRLGVELLVALNTAADKHA